MFNYRSCCFTLSHCLLFLYLRGHKKKQKKPNVLVAVHLLSLLASHLHHLHFVLIVEKCHDDGEGGPF